MLICIINIIYRDHASLHPSYNLITDSGNPRSQTEVDVSNDHGQYNLAHL